MPRINNSEGASVDTHQGLHVYGNTHGFVGGYPTTSHTVSCVVLAGSGEDMQRDYWYTSSRDWRELTDAEGDRPGKRAAHASPGWDPRKFSTRRAPVLFVPELARGLIGHFVAAIRGSSQYRQSSFLLNAAGRADISRADSRSRSGRIYRKRWAARRSTKRAWPRATAN